LANSLKQHRNKESKCMRVVWVIAVSVAASQLSLAHASDPAAGPAARLASASEPRAELPPPVALRATFLSEARIGVFGGDLWSEKGTGNLHAEVLFAKPFTPSDLFASYFVPRPHIGSSLNLNGSTSVAFAGLTWNIDMTPQIFLEASLGGAVHNRHRDDPIRAAQATPGCSPSFRETASVGYRISERLSFTATVERFDNAGLCAENRSITNIGARIGYSF
jgi:lipid A 3-O-deacylase